MKKTIPSIVRIIIYFLVGGVYAYGISTVIITMQLGFGTVAGDTLFLLGLGALVLMLVNYFRLMRYILAKMAESWAQFKEEWAELSDEREI